MEQLFEIDKCLNQFYPNLRQNSSDYVKMYNMFKGAYEVISKLSSNTIYSKDELITCFDLKFKSITHFQTYRLVVIRTMSVLNYNPETISNIKSIQYDDVCAEIEFERLYWGNLNSLIGYVESATDVYGRDSIGPRIVAELIWFGIRVTDIRFIKIKDVDFQNNTVRFGDEIIRINDQTSYDISAYINENNKETYVFENKCGKECSETAIKRKLLRLNEPIKLSGKQFDCRTIWYSGLFSRVYDGSDNLSQYARKDIVNAYENWENVYRGVVK